MEFIFELLFDLVFEGSLSIAKSKNVSKAIRYPLIVIISLFIVAIISLICGVGVALLVRHSDYVDILGGIIMIVLAIIMIIASINNIKKEVSNRK